MMSFAKKFFGSVNDRKLKPMRRRVQKINTLEPMIEALSDQALRAKTDEFRKRLADGATLDDILDEAFAVVRKGAKRSLGMRHFDVQLLGGMVLHNGAIAEMRTGEGKTLVATLPVYLNALRGEGVHVVTVNDYLAARDAEGQALRLPRPDHRRYSRRNSWRWSYGRSRPPRGLCLRYHVRHQQ